MAAIHTARTLKPSAALAAATAVACTEWDNTASYGGLVTVRLSNGASAPTTAPLVQIFVGEASGVKRLLYAAGGDTVNNSVTDIVVEIPPSAMFVNVSITNGATNAITVEAFSQELTTV